MDIIEALVDLLVKKNQTEYLRTQVYAEIFPTGRDEFKAAGQEGFKAAFKVEIWAFEYDGQTEIELDGKRFAIYRTYGPKPSGKIELYAAERVGKG